MRMHILAGLLALSAGAAQAADIAVIGLFPGKAVLVVDGAAPKTYAVGSTFAGGVKLVAVDQASATLDIGGKRVSMAIGSHVNRAVPSGNASVTLQADGSGHFYANGQINGGSVRMLVDTGATMIAMPASDAVRLGINYRKGQPAYVSTANGTAQAFRVTLDTVRIGDVELSRVDAVVQESGLPFILLGMSFLKRTEMLREGEQMTLKKRF